MDKQQKTMEWIGGALGRTLGALGQNKLKLVLV